MTQCPKCLQQDYK